MSTFLLHFSDDVDKTKSQHKNCAIITTQEREIPVHDIEVWDPHVGLLTVWVEL
jgi:hypothetical protein